MHRRLLLQKRLQAADFLVIGPENHDLLDRRPA